MTTKHACTGPLTGGPWYGPAVTRCFANADGVLVITNDEYDQTVPFCPFCGFEGVRPKEEDAGPDPGEIRAIADRTAFDQRYAELVDEEESARAFALTPWRDGPFCAITSV